MSHSIIRYTLILLSCAAFLAACSAPPPPQVIIQVVTATAAPEAPVVPAVAVATATRVPPTATSAPPPTVQSAPTALVPPPTATSAPPPPPPPPSPTPPKLVVVGIPGDKDKIDGQVIFPEYKPARTELVFQAKARDPRASKQDGAGIKSVDFTIRRNNQVVYKRTENNAAYCAFGGGEPNCVIFRFADNGWRWPGTNLPIQNGEHKLTVDVTPLSGDEWSPVEISFQIQR